MDQSIAGNPLPNSYQGTIAGPLIIYSAILLLVNMVVVALRFYVRVRVIRKVGNDDIALGLTLVRFSSRYVIYSCGVCSNSLTGLNHCKCRRDRVWCVVNPVCCSDCRPVLTRCLRVATRLGLGRHIETLLLNEKSTLLKVCGDPRAPNWPATR